MNVPAAGLKQQTRPGPEFCNAWRPASEGRIHFFTYSHAEFFRMGDLLIGS